MEKLRIIVVFISLPLILSGCSLPFGDKAPERPEVLFAQECGVDGLKCCVTEPACTYGQKCCTDPADSSRNRCADECTCGGQDAFCCTDGAKCKAGLTCQSGNCVPCGTEGKACCSTADSNVLTDGLAVYDPVCPGKSASSTALACFKETCVACGLPGNPCCSQGDTCLAPAAGKAECSQGLCQLCGANGQPACQNEPHCLPGHLLNNGSCLPCGQPNQPCCQNGEGQQACDAKTQLVCELGFCK
jgi:hypothetical protein